MDNKGQSLIIFVLLLPLILLLIMGIIDLGNYHVTKGKYVNEIKSTIKYSFTNENISKEKIENLLNSNIGGVKEVKIDNNQITIIVKDKVHSLFSNLNYDINLSYTGDKVRKKIIEE